MYYSLQLELLVQVVLYRSETILNFIGITKEEEILLNLEGILSKNEYKRRQQISNKVCQKKRYRNENNLTKTEQKRLEEFTKIAELELQGLSLRQIAKELGKDATGLSRKINKEYNKIRLCFKSMLKFDMDS